MTEQTNETSGRIRINRFLAQCGLGSRRACEKLVLAGKILVNGVKVVNLSTAIDPQTDRVEQQGKALKPVRMMEYYAYHKPRGVIVTAMDPEGRETVYEAIKKNNPKDLSHLKYVGRLDCDSQGLLLLTNDGDLIHAVTHPRYHVKKVYLVRSSEELTPEKVQDLLIGVESEGQTLCAGKVTPMPPRARGEFWYEIDLYEGRKRQIRRMFEAVGCTVLELKRTQFGPVRLGDLKQEIVRPLTNQEIASLLAAGYEGGALIKKKGLNSKPMAEESEPQKPVPSDDL